MKHRILTFFATAALAAQANAYLGYFDPEPFRNTAVVKFVDAQIPGIPCLSLISRPHEVVLAPLLVLAMGCTDIEKGVVIVPLTPGVGTINNLMNLGTPDAVLGHEVLHIFSGHFHTPLVPQIDSNISRRLNREWEEKQ
jgi:hypothetical protein